MTLDHLLDPQGSVDRKKNKLRRRVYRSKVQTCSITDGLTCFIDFN